MLSPFPRILMRKSLRGSIDPRRYLSRFNFLFLSLSLSSFFFLYFNEMRFISKILRRSIEYLRVASSSLEALDELCTFYFFILSLVH